MRSDGVGFGAVEKPAAASVSEAADLAIRETSDLGEAALFLEKMAKADRGLYEALTRPLLLGACRVAVCMAQRVERRRVWNPPPAAHNGHRLLALAETLMNFPLPSGKKLRDARRGDLMDASRDYLGRAADMAHKGRWLGLVANAVGEGTVAESLTPDRLAKLHEESANG